MVLRVFLVVDPSTGDLTTWQAQSSVRNQHLSTTKHFLKQALAIAARGYLAFTTNTGRPIGPGKLGMRVLHPYRPSGLIYEYAPVA